MSAADDDAPPANAHPKIKAIHEYWRKAMPAPGTLPGRKHIDPVHIPQLLENVWLLDVVGEPIRLRFRLLGGALRQMGIRAVPGQYVDEIADPNSAPVEQMRRAAAERRPVWFRGPATAPHRSQMFTLERIHLPLAADGEQVDMLLCLTVFYARDGHEI
jgi:hypothetical protein